jgi:signal transduction histidine kinase
MNTWLLLACIAVIYGADILHSLGILRRLRMSTPKHATAQAFSLSVLIRALQVIFASVLLLVFVPQEYIQPREVFVAFVLFFTASALVVQGIVIFSAQKAKQQPSTSSRSRYTFPINPRFDEEWSKNPQYYELQGMRLRQVALPHWQTEEYGYSSSNVVIEGVLILSTIVGKLTWKQANTSFDTALQISDEMRLQREWAVLISDSIGVTSSSSEVNKGSARRYPELLARMQCYLVVGTATKIFTKLAQPFAPATFRSVKIFDDVEKAVLTALNAFAPLPSSTAEKAALNKHSVASFEETAPFRYLNPLFEEYWQRTQEYFTYNDVRIRQVRSDAWNYQGSSTTRFALSIVLLEHGIILERVMGTGTSEEAKRAIANTKVMLQEMNLEQYPNVWIVDGTELTATLDNEAIRHTGDFFAQLQNLQRIYLILPPAIAIISRFALLFSKEVYKKLQIFTTLDEALKRVVVVGHLQKNDEKNDERNDERNSSENTDSITGKINYHERRIAEIYTMLAKISDTEPNTIAVPDVPPEDMYYDVFRAMSIVNDDKRRQMDALIVQQEMLQLQGVEIQEANTMLSERLAQLNEQNTMLGQLNHEKNELMGIVAHDLKNPIGAVRGLADVLILGTAETEENAHIHNIAHQVISISNRMLELVKNLLDVNRLETGNMNLHLVHADITPIAETSVWSFTPAAEAKNIRIHFISEATQSMVLVDEQAMTQVMDNIISNAVKYSPLGKNIYVRIKGGHSSLAIGHLSNNNSRPMTHDQVTNSFLRIEVADEGPGISEEDMRRLFGKFARLSAQPTGGEHSTGLGLSIVKKMVEAMQGRVWCESELGKGATFIVELPHVS